MDKQNETMRLAELRRLGAAEVDSQRAIKTLQQAGYTDCGGELWKPPLGKALDFGLEMPVPTVWEYAAYEGWSPEPVIEDVENNVETYTADQLRDYAAAAVLREREACAAMVEDQILNYSESYVIDGCAAAIRNRSEAMNPPAKSPI